MPQILVPDEIHQDGLARLRDRERYVLDDGALTSENRRERLAIADGMIVRGTRIDRALLDAAPRLRFVCRHGVGYDHVDVPALTERGILLAVTPEANAASVAEHALMLMLASARQLRATDVAVRRGEWRVRGSSQAFDLADRTVLLIGFGRIGIRVARLCVIPGAWSSGIGQAVLRVWRTATGTALRTGVVRPRSASRLWRCFENTIPATA